MKRGKAKKRYFRDIECLRQDEVEKDPHQSEGICCPTPLLDLSEDYPKSMNMLGRMVCVVTESDTVCTQGNRLSKTNC